MDVLGKLVLEVRDDSAVDSIAHGRVRGADPAGAVGDEHGDQRGPGEYVAYVVMELLDDPRVAPRVPAHRAVIVARCYGRTRAEAASLRWAVSNALHLVGPRLKANGLAIWQSLDTGGSGQARDPETQQPYETVVFSALASTVAVVP
jgi:hypothetical protein